MGLIHTPEVHQLCSGVVPAAASVLATEGFSQSWWIYVVVFLAVAAAWAGVPVIGGVAAATAGALASQGKLELAAVVAMVAVAGEVLQYLNTAALVFHERNQIGRGHLGLDELARGIESP